MTFKSSPEVDIDVRCITDILAATEPDVLVPYATLSQAIGRDIQNGARVVLIKAVRRQLQDNRVWLTVRNVGIKLGTNVQIAEGIPESARRTIARTTKRSARKLATVNLETLTREQTTGVLAAQSMLGAIAAFTNRGALPKLQASIESSQDKHALPLAKTIEVFRR